MSATMNPNDAAASAERKRIVVLDDEESIRRLLRVILAEEGCEVFATDDGFAALSHIQSQGCDLVIQDLRMPKMDGLIFLQSLKKRAPDIPVIVLTAFGTWETAVEAMRLGAYTHLPKPFDNDELRLLINRALERGERRPTGESANLPIMIGVTDVMQRISRLIVRIAPTDSTVLISGESGTGKELVAHAVHDNSLRAGQPFLPVNCGAFTETLLESELFGHVKGAFTNAVNDRKGVFECADRGTLFLDEVGEMSPAMQVKLLRVLETRTYRPVGGQRNCRVDVRIIAATNRDLRRVVQAGEFREDLYYRLNVIPIHLPPLRERCEDIPLLAGNFLARFGKQMNKHVSGFENDVLKMFINYAWPGNIRELENTVERAVALSVGERITVAEVTGPITEPKTSALSADADDAAAQAVLPEAGMNMEAWLEDRERKLILQALDRTNGNLTEAAKLLGMSFRSIRYRVAKLKIER
jgi:two-component system response regulator PilR (NtrC family)